MYGYGSVPGEPGNMGGVNLSGASGTTPSFSGGTSPKVRIDGKGVPNPMDVSTPDISLGGGNLNNAGVMKRARAMQGRAKNMMDGMHTRVVNNMQRSALMPRSALLGGALMSGAVPSAVQDLQEGNPVGGITTLATTTGGLAVTNQLAKGIKNPYAKLATMAVGGLISGGIGQGVAGVAEDVVGSVTGKGPSEGAGRKRNIKDARNQAEVMQILGGAALQPFVQAQMDISKAAMDQRILESQRMLPIINQMKNADLVRQQALNASNAQNYMAMGTVATAGKLAVGAQEQAGANLRTAMTANPYANSTLQAPNISF